MRYPKPSFDTNNSPIITPISDILILILKVLNILTLLAGSITLKNICFLLALKLFKRVMYELSVDIKALYKLIILKNNDIIRAINIIELKPAPHQIIISGPSETLGKELIIVKYGSNILATISLNQRKDEIIKPKIDAIRKLIIVSLKVTSIWRIRTFLSKLVIVLKIFLGDEKRNVLITLNSASACHNKNNKTIIII